MTTTYTRRPIASTSQYWNNENVWGRCPKCFAPEGTPCQTRQGNAAASAHIGRWIVGTR